MGKFDLSSFQGTVVGLLFDKTGHQIRGAIREKIRILDSEVTELRKSIQDVDEFLESKEDELEELNTLYTERHNEKDAQARPFYRQIDEVHKAWCDKEFDFNRETERLIGEKAVEFEEGFKEFSERFVEIDELAEEVEDDVNANPTLLVPSSYSTTDSLSGETKKDILSLRRITNISENPLLPTEQDKAATKLTTLRNRVFTYRGKVDLIQSRINTLESESDELRLVSRHLNDEREYTLDLDRLSALGFDY